MFIDTIFVFFVFFASLTSSLIDRAGRRRVAQKKRHHQLAVEVFGP
jgi:hypothetical protein